MTTVTELPQLNYDETIGRDGRFVGEIISIHERTLAHGSYLHSYAQWNGKTWERIDNIEIPVRYS